MRLHKGLFLLFHVYLPIIVCINIFSVMSAFDNSYHDCTFDFSCSVYLKKNHTMKISQFDYKVVLGDLEEPFSKIA